MDKMLKERLLQELTEEQLEKISGGDLFEDYLDDARKLESVRAAYNMFGLEIAISVGAAYGWSESETKQRLGIAG